VKPLAAGDGSKAARVRQQKLHNGVPAGGSSRALPPPVAHRAPQPQQQALPPAPAAAKRPKLSQRPPAAEPVPAPAQQPSEPQPQLSKRQKLMQSVHLPVRLPVTPAAKSALGFESDWHDHCESPFEAYRDIEPLLFQLATKLGRTKAELRIWDPYYCEGTALSARRRACAGRQQG
jgi:hypothetical protein